MERPALRAARAPRISSRSSGWTGSRPDRPTHSSGVHPSTPVMEGETHSTTPSLENSTMSEACIGERREPGRLLGTLGDVTPGQRHRVPHLPGPDVEPLGVSHPLLRLVGVVVQHQLLTGVDDRGIHSRRAGAAVLRQPVERTRADHLVEGHAEELAAARLASTYSKSTIRSASSRTASSRT